MKFKPYDFQQKVYDDVMCEIEKGERSIIAQLPTRAGKSIIATLLIEYFSGIQRQPVYFVGHKTILISQMSADLTEHGIKHGIIAPWAPQLKYRTQVISKDTLFNRYKKMKSTGWKAPKLIIVDECHMAMGATYKEILDSYPESIIVGLTATPIRLDQKPLKSIFSSMVIGPSIKELQAKKRLCQIESFIVDFDDSGLKANSRGDYKRSDVLEKVDKPAIIKDVVRWWEQLAKGKKTLTFCASIKHAEDIAEEFDLRGYPSVAVSSNDGKIGIKKKLDAYYSGKYINLVSVDLFTMGFTVKECDCILQCRPTESLMIYMQSLGRGMIWLEGKVLTNIDCVNNWTRHGRPEDDREWTLEGVNKKDKEIAKLKKCPQCFHPVPVSSRICPDCDYLWTETATAGCRIPEERSGRMIRLDENNLLVDIARNAKTFDDAVKIAGDFDTAMDIWVRKLKMKVDKEKYTA